MKDEDTGDKLEMEKEENPEAEADESLSAGDEKDGPEEAREVRKPKRQVPDRQGLKVFGAVALLVILIAAAAAAISAHDKKTAENAVTEAGFFAISSDSVKDIGPYPGGAVVLTANDIEYIDRYGELITSNDHTFSSPVMAVSGKDLIVYDRGGYSVQIAYSTDGRPDGEWKQQQPSLFSKTKRHGDGGHGMLFTAPDGTLTLSIHSPNNATENDPTTALLVPVADTGDTLVTRENDNFLTRLYFRLYYKLKGSG